MIKVENVTKRFGDFYAVKDLSCNIPKGCIYGLIGSNGAGKSTFLRMITGVYKADMGSVSIENQLIYENSELKAKIAYVPDELYFFGNSTLKKLGEVYSLIYPNFDNERFNYLVEVFKLKSNVSINSFSKGMKRQAATILALASKPDYIFFDETFDGLDPVMRNLVKNLIVEDVVERKTTVIITSHSLRELEDTCDQLALLHEGGIVFESDIIKLKTSLFKIQIAFNYDYDEELFKELEILDFNKKGSVASFIVREDKEKVTNYLKTKNPILLDILPLSLEEVFIHEMQAIGYSFDSEVISNEK